MDWEFTITLILFVLLFGTALFIVALAITYLFNIFGYQVNIWAGISVEVFVMFLAWAFRGEVRWW